MATVAPQPGDSYRPTTLDAGAHGTLRGIEIVGPNGVKARRFCQVPFARPPVGERRWRKPEPLPADYSWAEVRGEEFGALAPQPEYQVRNDKGDLYPMGVPNAVLDEDCLTANVWVPAGTPPKGGWPTWVFLHGGWLQIGNPAMTDKNDPANLVSGPMPALVIVPGYRLGLFGFLAGKEVQAENDDGTAGNFGFWDQRLAIEWAAENAHHFGGNGANITIAGLSAGAYSVQMQLAYELNSGAKPLISRAMMFSNALPAQCKTIEESQAGFDGLAEACGVDANLSGEEKMAALRKVPMQELVDKVMHLKIHTFRGVTDGAFVHPEMYTRVVNGDFARRFGERGLAVIIGETPQEEVMYGATNPPRSLNDIAVQLENYYNPAAARQLVACWPLPSALQGLKPDEPITEKAQVDAVKRMFGDIVAHGQVYVSERALVRSLLQHCPPENVLRFRLAWKPKYFADNAIFSGVVTHADDQWAWWYLSRFGFSAEEDKVIRAWLAPVVPFIAGDYKAAAEQWYGFVPSQKDQTRFRELRDGKIAVVEDERWARCIEIADQMSK
ncbi:carboxylesterase-lipase family protein [Cutaneotrichosporon oleaginosum]|uniref:Carboxylic ester hydrolase n=1 Tax=Cutaneotrichosporon oleaginosum TaxID=879819 RepID=A0A0J0XW70_9TREE|nr:carboxylesterase-lipase family protein [Cutaneotrichosporon oleaginosum]KLT45340.1 carboxylesterase-lipase family protein [Cutaneotrichosporon oleaginosum]